MYECFDIWFDRTRVQDDLTVFFFNFPSFPPDAFTVPEHPGLVLYPSGGPYHQYTVLSSILKQWWIWLLKGSN